MDRQLDIVDKALLWSAGAILLFLILLGLVGVARDFARLDGKARKPQP